MSPGHTGYCWQQRLSSEGRGICWDVMSQLLLSQLLLQVVIVVTFAALCFGCGYLTAFIVTRNHWRDAMIKRGIARYNWHTGKWEWGEPPKKEESRYPVER